MRRDSLSRISLLVLVFFLGMTGQAYAEKPEKPLDHLALYNGIWADTNLPDLPGKAVTGELDFKRSYYAGVAYSRTLVQDFAIHFPLMEEPAEGWDLELEGSLLKHYRGQTNWESNLACVLRTREFMPFSALGWTFAGGIGGSYAFENPRFEKGPNGEEGEDTVNFQSHLLLGMDFISPNFPRLHLVTRIHHRSGIYGLISPRKTGSNFLALGVRVDY